MPAFTRRALSDAWDAGYEHASKLATSPHGVGSGHCKDIDCTFSECGDPRVAPWTEDHDGFYRVFLEYRLGFKSYLEDRGGSYADLAALIKTSDPAWLLGPEPTE